MHFDHGYGKQGFLSQIAQNNYSVVAISPNIDSHHSFMLQNEVE